MKKWMTTISLAALALMAAACNTVEGFGQDVETAGEKIEKTAESNK